jgi:peroxiredoxin
MPGIGLAVLMGAMPCLAGDAAATDAKSTSSATTDLGEYPSETLPASDGSEVSLPAARGANATVIMCMSVECPISNEFLPAIQEVARAYRDKGVNFVGVNPNGGESLEDMAAYAKERELSFPFLKDEGGKISRRLLFNVTPEARLFDTQGQIVYQGRVDNRYRAGGGRPGAKIKHDLADALDEVLAGKPVSQSRTRTVGCPIQFAAPAAN